ncbi:MAG: 3-hydroxyacyl-CoA dehydrogenase family protein [Actinobacteria bacterium]|nr:3-hydroxyacyl-CoA dehydrogenase family protein [Actinomycetota bacterium]
MGVQIGCEYALGGHRVNMVARDLDALTARIDAGLAMLVDLLEVPRKAVDGARQNIWLTDSVADAATGCDIVVESLPEDLDLKVELLRLAAAASPGAVIASNTSSLRITDLGRAIDAPHRTLGTHYWNPPLLMPLVEVIAGEETDPDLVRRISSILAQVGKTPIKVAGDVPGFVWNRLQFAVVREAVNLIDAGVIRAAELDEIIKDGLARRWRRVGPLRGIALGGLETWNAAGREIVADLSNVVELPDLAAFAIEDGDHERDVRARDRGLVEDLLADRRRA